MWYDIFKFGLENRAKIKDFLDPKKRLKGKIDSCLVLSAGNCYPVQFCLNTEQPCLGLYLKINNFSKNLEIVLNGGIIEGIYVNSRSIVQNLQFVDRNDVSPLKSNNIYLGQSLDAASVNRLKEIEDIYNLEARLIIKFNIDNIKLKTERRFSFDNIPCKLSLHKSPLTLYKETVEKEADVLQNMAFPATSTEKLLTDPGAITDKLIWWLGQQREFVLAQTRYKKPVVWHFSVIDETNKLSPGSAKKRLPEILNSNESPFPAIVENVSPDTIRLKYDFSP